MESDASEPLMQPVAVRSFVQDSNLPELGSTKFNFLLLKRLFRIFRLLFPRLWSVTLLFFVFLVFISAAAQYNYYNAGLIPSRFYGSLTAHNLNEFKNNLYQSVIVLLSACVCKSAVILVSGIVYVRWRALLTQHIHKLYLKGLNFYKISVIYSAIDNPDQRITQDVERFCDQLANQMLPKLILWPFVVAYYTYKTFTTMGYIGLLALYGYFIVATLINKFLMGPVISLVVEQERREGDFRFHHMHVRSNAEPIAFYGGELLEREKAKNLLGRLLKTQLNLYHWMFPLNFSINMFDYFGSIITYVILGVIIFSGSSYSNQTPSELAVTISQNAFFSLYLINNFSTLVDQSSNLADLAGYGHRVGHFLEVLNIIEKQQPKQSTDLAVTVDSDGGPPDDSPSQIQMYSVVGEGDVIAAVIDHVTISSPQSTDHILIEDLDLKFEKGKNILITGQSGSGKTSFLRVLKQLWTPLKGSAYLSLIEADTEVMFLPQQPLLTSGSLSEQITYPKKPKADDHSNSDSYVFENRVSEALRLVGLSSLKERFGGIDVPFEGNWNDCISPGEMQKIAFARLVYHKPGFAILDEATSALSEEDEEYFYSLLKQMGITFLSVGHRSTIRKFHDIMIHFTGNGNWSINTINQ